MIPMKKTESILEAIPSSILFEKIGEICAAVNTVVTTKDLLEISLKKTIELFGANRGSIFILDENGRELVLKIAFGLKSDEQESMVKRLGEGIVGKVAELKQPIFVDDITKDSHFQKYQSRSSYRTPSFICAPLIVKDQLLGVINIADKESGHHFIKEEMQLLDFLTSQIALNYKRIQLYNKFKSIIKETKDLKNKLGQTDQETQHLKKQIVIQERLASIGKLAGGIAHEFNNPLDGVMRYTNLCLDHVDDEDEVLRGYLLEVKHGLNRMANIVKNLLACSRNEFPSKQKVHVEEALEYALTTKQTAIQHKNLKIIKEVGKDLPIIPDLGLERVLSNLLSNAIDATSDGGTVTFKASLHGDCLRLVIADTGTGILQENLSRIFEPFYTTKDFDKGCGLGLTIVSEIIKSYNGHIDVKSKKGKGTTFTVDLPMEVKRYKR